MKRLASYVFPYAIFMAILVVMPLLFMAYYSVSDQDGFTWKYLASFTHEDILNTFIYSIGIAMETTILCLVLGYPIAYILSKKELGLPGQLITFFVLPMAINMLLNTFALVAVLDVLHIPLGRLALTIGMVYNFLPFMVQPLYNSLCNIDPYVVDAAKDLGASKFVTFYRVILPISVPGIVSGIMMVFMPTISTFAISELLTMNKVKLFGSVVQYSISTGMMNYGAAFSIVMLLVIVVTQVYINKNRNLQ